MTEQSTPTGPVVADVIDGDQPLDRDKLTIGREALTGERELWLHVCDGELWTPSSRAEITHVVMVPPAPPPLAVGAGVRWISRGEADYAWITELDVEVGNSSYVRGISPPEQMPDWESPVGGVECYRTLPDGTRKSVWPEVAERVTFTDDDGDWMMWTWLEPDRAWLVKIATKLTYVFVRPDQAAILARALTSRGDR